VNHVVLALTIQQADIVAAALGQLPLKVAYETFESIKQQRARQQEQDAANKAAPVADAPGYEGPAQAAAD
jgi:hypothetical protein